MTDEVGKNEWYSGSSPLKRQNYRGTVKRAARASGFAGSRQGLEDFTDNFLKSPFGDSLHDKSEFNITNSISQKLKQFSLTPEGNISKYGLYMRDPKKRSLRKIRGIKPNRRDRTKRSSFTDKIRSTAQKRIDPLYKRRYEPMGAAMFFVDKKEKKKKLKPGQQSYGYTEKFFPQKEKKENEDNTYKVAPSYFDKYVSGVNDTRSKEIVDNITSFLQKSSSEDVIALEQIQTFNELNEQVKEDHHQELLSVLVQATAAKKRAEKEMRVESKKREKTAKTAKTEKKPEAKAETKPAAKPEAKAETKPAAEAPPTAVKETAKKATKKAATKVGPRLSGKAAVIAGTLAATGMSANAQSNVLAMIEEESQFRPRSEELEKWTGKNLFNVYGGPQAMDKNGNPSVQKGTGKPMNASGNVIRFNSLEDANALAAKGPVAVGDIIYGGRMGNDQPGDGYKYRGRGYIQITGKDMYRRIGKELGIDLVANPDLANDPKIAAKIVPIFFKLKLIERKLNEKDLENIDTVNSLTGSASAKSKKERKEISELYKKEFMDADKISSNSIENVDMKKYAMAESQMFVMQQNNTTVVNRNIVNSSAREQELNPTLR